MSFDHQVPAVGMGQLVESGGRGHDCTAPDVTSTYLVAGRSPCRRALLLQQLACHRRHCQWQAAAFNTLSGGPARGRQRRQAR